MDINIDIDEYLNKLAVFHNRYKINNFYGKVTLKFYNGELQLMKVSESFKPKLLEKEKRKGV